jgi:glycerol-3-phosphate dehydrogenase (NAD(P)+)
LRPARLLVLGDGGWGTALSLLAHRSGHRVSLWSHDPAYAAVLARTRRNPKFLPGVEIPPQVVISSELDALTPGVEVVFSVIPTQFLRGALAGLAPRLPAEAAVVSCTKGIERNTLLLPSRILAERLGGRPIVVLSGPTHAEEVARGLPASVVAASLDLSAARRICEVLSGPTFRVYTNPDPVGVEIGGAVKNVIALAAGIADGLDLGDNTRAALITRGATEVARLGLALGARRETFSGLAGIGDLIVTCTSAHSRNHSVGYRIGRGETLELILRSTEKVPEGVETTRSLVELARRTGVEMPITMEVHAVLFEEKPPREAVQSLMARSRKDELEDQL